MKDKKKWIIGISACVLLMVSVFFVFNQGKSNEQVVTEYFELLKKKDYKIIGTKVTNGKDVKDARIYSHFALVIGNEGQGISNDIDNLCDEYLYIKMNENCESLNAGVAASILLYEINNK